MGPWVQGLFGTHSSFTHIMAEQKCVCGHVWGDPLPTNDGVIKADGHFTVARTLYNPYHQLWVPRSKGYLVHIASFAHIMAEQRCVCGHVWGDPVPTNYRVLKADGHFTVAKTLYNPYHQLWVPRSKGYLVHIAPFAHIMAEQRCVCGHVWGDPAPTNYRVLKADGHFTVASTLFNPYHQLWVPGSKGYSVHIAPLHT